MKIYIINEFQGIKFLGIYSLCKTQVQAYQDLKNAEHYANDISRTFTIGEMNTTD